MISPEKLKRFPFFAPFNAEQLRQIAMLSDEDEVKKGEVLFEECQPATTFYVLQKGGIELFYNLKKSTIPKKKRNLK